MSASFWVFECTFVANNNLLMGEVFVAPTRAELVAGMQRFFESSRAPVMLAEVLGAYFVNEGACDAYFDAKPFVTVRIANELLPFAGDALAPVIGDLEGGTNERAYLAKGRALAVDAEEEDEGDDDEMVLAPFSFLFDAKAFRESLQGQDGSVPASGSGLSLVRPIGAEGMPEHYDADWYGPPPAVGPGWWDAEPGSKPKRFDPEVRFVDDLVVPMV